MRLQQWGRLSLSSDTRDLVSAAQGSVRSYLPAGLTLSEAGVTFMNLVGPGRGQTDLFAPVSCNSSKELMDGSDGPRA